MSSEPAQVSAPSHTLEEDNFISFAPIWSVIRRYRNWLELSFLALIVVGGGLLATAYLYLPKKIDSSLEFELTFPDAALRLYPNKMPFSTQDLLGTAFLRQVYKNNHVNMFIGFDEFKSRISIYSGGIELNLLQNEFRNRLDDRKLAFADREKIEADFSEKLKEIPPLFYKLKFEQFGRDARLVPPVLSRKVLEDILRLWSADAIFQKRVLAFAVQIPSSIPITEKHLDPLVLILEFNDRIRSLSMGLGELSRLPAADQAVLSNGLKWADLALRLENLQEIRTPQIRSALVANISDPAQAVGILRVFRTQVRVRQDRLRLANERLRSYISTSRDYLSSQRQASRSATTSHQEAGVGSGVGTQLQISETFLTKLMELDKDGIDSQYRNSLNSKILAARQQVVEEDVALKDSMQIVEGIEKRLSEIGKIPINRNKGKDVEAIADPTDFLAVLLTGCRELNALIGDTEQLSAQITQNYMSPQTNMYRITRPFMCESSSPLSPRSAGLFLLTFILVGLGLTFLVCFAHDQARKSQA
ncbi:MAG: hypothetical protein EBT07_02390 [Actinobacteria bacterium]|nr:hypothetical protein [Actinomycetota bacterium]